VTTLFVHIGAAKTGSSAIQSFIRRNLARFAEVGVTVPDSMLGHGGPASGNHVFPLETLAKDGDAAGLAERMAAVEAAQPDARALLLSAENLSNAGRSAVMAEAARRFDLRVVLYVRRQDELLTSAWQQWHSKIESDFNAWLVMGLKQYGHWDRILSEWERVVGPERITVRVFERESFVGGNLLVDFLDALGLGGQADLFDTTPEQVNPSFTDALTALVAGNTAIFKDVHDNRFYNNVEALTGSALIEKRRVSLLTPAQRDRIVEYYRPVNERVAARYFPDRDRLFGRVEHAKYRYLDAERFRDEQLRVIGTIMAALVERAAK
jgi:hypothetical protein